MSEGIKVVNVTLPSELESLEIIPIGDVHEGEEMFDLDLFDGLIRYILEKPNRYVILNGDLLNNAIKTSVSDTYGNNNPEEEIGTIVFRLSQIKDRILAMGSGNHEERTLKLTGIDPSRYLAVRLGIEERYSSNSFMLFVTLGHFRTPNKYNNYANVYSIFVQHGYGGGKKNGSKLNNLNDSDQIVSNADLYIMGHTHTPIANVKSSFVADTRHGTIKRQNKYFLMHNAFMRFGGYGLRFGYSPAATEITYATLSGTKKKISLTIGI
jgi:predicted phosphodiesterase